MIISDLNEYNDPNESHYISFKSIQHSAMMLDVLMAFNDDPGDIKDQ